MVASPLRAGLDGNKTDLRVISESRSFLVYDLGMMEYERALLVQREIRDAVRSGMQPSTLLLLEHPPVLTIGTSGGQENIRVSRNDLEAQGIQIHHTERGGNITYHGPGQIVGYPILDLRSYGRDILRYLWLLEKVIIDVLGVYGLEGGRLIGSPGVWIQTDRKIASVGLHVRRWVTSHGFALNISPDLTHFDFIYSCGIRDKGVTSMERELGIVPPLSEVKTLIARTFESSFV